MAADSAIEWTDKTWTPIVGCDAVSPACANCYAALMAARLEAMGQEKYRGVATRVGNKGKWTGRINLWEPEVLAPLSARKPKRWFLTSMGDVFHDGVPFEFIDRLFAIMALTPHHTYYVLTKRPDRAANYLLYADRDEAIGHNAFGIIEEMEVCTGEQSQIAAGLVHGAAQPAAKFQHDRRWPLPNVLIGSTAEDQTRANERRQHMERIAAAGWRTFVSYEPALGPVDWAGWEFLSWLISGGESGHGARPSHPDWHRSARDFCAKHRIPYLFKQWGEWAPMGAARDTMIEQRCRYGEFHGGTDWVDSCLCSEGDGVLVRVGKRAAGRLLDGVEHNGVPTIPSPTPAAA